MSEGDTKEWGPLERGREGGEAYEIKVGEEGREEGRERDRERERERERPGVPLVFQPTKVFAQHGDPTRTSPVLMHLCLPH